LPGCRNREALPEVPFIREDRRLSLTSVAPPLTAASCDSTDSRHDPMEERTLKGFGARLTALRQARGLTQEELGAAVGVSNRMIAYYERDGAEPHGALFVKLARGLRCSTDALLGVTAVSDTLAPKTARLLKRLQRIEELPPPISAPCSRSSMPCSTRGVARRRPHARNARRAERARSATKERSPTSSSWSGFIPLAGSPTDLLRSSSKAALV
jgi:transcriptional regulator with XRE-family HTH domain